MPKKSGFSPNSKLWWIVRVVVMAVLLMMFCSVTRVLPDEHSAKTRESDRPGVEPLGKKNCPASHPIKGNFTTYSGERCIYHMPGQRFYEKTQPERCYATEEEAILDGCRPSKV